MFYWGFVRVILYFVFVLSLDHSLNMPLITLPVSTLVKWDGKAVELGIILFFYKQLETARNILINKYSMLTEPLDTDDDSDDGKKKRYIVLLTK